MSAARRVAGIIVFLSGVGTAAAAIHFEDFASTQGLSLVGDAALAGKILRLTPTRRSKAGAVWFREKQSVQSGFETTFQFQMTEQGGEAHGGDGFAFVLQNSGPAALGGRGSAGGFAVADRSYNKHIGIAWSIAVFFDTYRNGNERDPSDNYISFCTHGRPSEMRWPANRLAFTPNLSIYLKDGKVHTARIVFRRPVLSVFLDNASPPVLQAAVDLSPVVDEQGSTWVGFTASTGWAHENHDILNWSFTSADVSSSMSVVSSQITFLMSACLPDRNLCTPERAVVERRDTGYHVILPGNLEWGAKIPNPSGQPVAVNDTRGIVCWDIKARGAEGCTGPSGSAMPAGSGFLMPDAAAGALISKTQQGQTWFSVNDHPGEGFKDNEGFYEFDVVMQ